MGICSNKNYKNDVKGMNEKHNHMLIFLSPTLRNEKNFICSLCGKNYENIPSFNCIKCHFDMCKECFDYTGGMIYNVFKDGQKGQISTHDEHVLVYGKSNTKGKTLKLNGKLLYTCKICDANYYADYIKCWSCPLCDYDVCDKCFSQKGGKIYS